MVHLSPLCVRLLALLFFLISTQRRWRPCWPIKYMWAHFTPTSTWTLSTGCRSKIEEINATGQETSGKVFHKSKSYRHNWISQQLAPTLHIYSDSDMARAWNNATKSMFFSCSARYVPSERVKCWRRGRRGKRERNGNGKTCWFLLRFLSSCTLRGILYEFFFSLHFSNHPHIL